MCHDMFFVPILTEALRHPDDVPRLREALERIAEQCDDPRRRVGRQQWHRFLRAALPDVTEDAERRAMAETALRMMLDDVLPASGGPEPQLVEALVGTMSSKEHFGVLGSVRASSERVPVLALRILHDDVPLASIDLPPAEGSIVRGIRPGTYTVALDTGRLLWTGELRENDLVWGRAFPERRLPVAAESREIAAPPSKRIPLPVAPLWIVVYPGVEAGAIQVTMADPAT